MTTLIEVRNSSGIVGRCDARCYNAKTPDCTCICGGKNHGAGQEKAIDNTRELAEDWLKRYAKEKGLENWTAEIPARDRDRDPVQLALPL